MSIILPIKSSVIFLIVLFLVLLVSSTIKAQEELTPGIAKYYPIEGDVTDGTIITFKDGVYTKSEEEFDNQVIGVIAENPAVSINSRISEKSYPVVDSGSVMVKVSNANGDINVGDKITTSLIPGVGMKTSGDGATIGIAREAFTPQSEKDIGKILVDLQLNYTYSKYNKEYDQEKFLNTNPLTNLFSYYRTSTVLKFITASAVVILSFIFGFITFRKISTKGLEALGRNPMASKIIIFNMAINIVVTVMIVTSGFILAYIILRI